MRFLKPLFGFISRENLAGYLIYLMVWGAGQYKFTDYTRIGLVLTLIVMAMTIFLAPLIYGF
ncbi:hypothetical protein DSCW_21050 [Desulfosarcina widdelii]|uniref:Uncharacterized protein n=1 Tax=Desulfosarcina widdelii TaxID=947919 RepID=A0A5K7Z1A4_9BACT|nr:hypothetical protein [Desulfosarcina widdelii]BBO74688.1 hypothetical protein DSCW_21050 [Desulfosarcina widdelii]